MCSLRLDDRRQRRRNPKLGSFRPERLRERHAREFVLSSDGRLTLAPVFRELADPSIAVSVGSGFGFQGATCTPAAAVPAVPLRRSSSWMRAASPARWPSCPDCRSNRVAVDKRDRVYAATAPDGKVYRVDAGGKPEVFYDPKVKYIWSLAFNSQGDLFVATGDGGEIHKVTPDGKGSVFFRTEETHARSLAVDAKDNVIVGTEPGGLIVRISPTGDGFVLHQASKREVTAIAVTDTGVIYAAAIGTKSSAPSSTSNLSIPTPTVQPAPGSPAGGAPRTGGNAASITPPVPAPAAPPSLSGGSDLYRISADGFPQRVWTHPQDIVYAIGFDSSKRPIVGTGNKGNVYRIDSDLGKYLVDQRCAHSGYRLHRWSEWTLVRSLRERREGLPGRSRNAEIR